MCLFYFLYNINFNYLLNGACTENLEQDKVWRQKFKEFILYLKSVGVNAFTITNPLILILVKKIYPEAICRVSTFSCVNTLEKAKYWESMGADIICADFVSINRNFALLRTMCEELKTAKIEILVDAFGPKALVIISIHKKDNQDIVNPPSIAIHSFW